ncbi:hypothetical protein [Infirmifilum sp. SLHALR2]
MQRSPAVPSRLTPRESSLGAGNADAPLLDHAPCSPANVVSATFSSKLDRYPRSDLADYPVAVGI